MSGHIKKAAIAKCRDRLTRARAALYNCRNAPDYHSFCRAWTDFLMAGGAIINIIETGARSTPQGRQWYGGERTKARADPLLRYMYQARNGEEHGLEPVVHHRPTGLLVGGPGESVVTSNLKFDSMGNPSGTFYNPEGKPLSVKIAPARPVLAPVRDERHGDVFDPPKEHLGKPISDPHPLTVGTLYLDYLEGFVAEAEARS